MSVPEKYKNKQNVEVRALYVNQLTTAGDMRAYLGDLFRVAPIIGNGQGATRWEVYDAISGWVPILWGQFVVRPYPTAANHYLEAAYVFTRPAFEHIYTEVL